MRALAQHRWHGWISRTQEGMGYMDMTIDGASGKRWNTASAYLRPALADKSRKVHLASHPHPASPPPAALAQSHAAVRARAASRRVRS